MLSSDTIYIQDDIIPHIEQKDAPEVIFEPKTALVESVEDLIRQEFPENAEKMIEIAKCESQLNPEAYNPEWHNGCQGSSGIFQVACVHGFEGDLFDPEYNIKVAKEIYQSQGYNAWVICSQ